MKRLIFFVSIISLTAFGQENTDIHTTIPDTMLIASDSTDSVDVRALVQSQFDTAREREKQESKVLPESKDLLSVDLHKAKVKKTAGMFLIENPAIIKAGVILISAVSIFSFVFLRRRRFKKRDTFNKIFKRKNKSRQK